MTEELLRQITLDNFIIGAILSGTALIIGSAIQIIIGLLRK